MHDYCEERKNIYIKKKNETERKKKKKIIFKDVQALT